MSETECKTSQGAMIGFLFALVGIVIAVTVMECNEKSVHWKQISDAHWTTTQDSVFVCKTTPIFDD